MRLWAIIFISFTFLCNGEAGTLSAQVSAIALPEAFNISLTPRDDGAYALEVEALNGQDERNLSVNGIHRIYLGHDTVDLTFIGGRALYRMENAPELVMLRYRYETATRSGQITRHREKVIRKLVHFQVSDSNIDSHTIPLWWSIIPPLLAIIMALVVREVIISLTAGIWLGALMLYGFSIENAFTALLRIGDRYLLNALSNPDRVSVILFTFLIGGMVAIVSRNGGMAGIVQRLSRYAKSSQKASFITYILGILIFFDDYANTLIVGNTMKPVTDRFRISREKLAYLVDSTAAPVAAIALVTTWIGAELGYIDEALQQINANTSAYSVFVHSLQYAFYPVLTLAFIFMLLYSKRDFGPMLKAEKRANEKGEVFKNKYQEEQAQEVNQSLQSLEPVAGIRYRWYNAVIPIATVIIGTIIGLLTTGYDAAQWAATSGWFNKLSFTIGNANSYLALIWGSLIGLIVAVVQSAATKSLRLPYAIESMMDGFKTMLPAVVILLLAWGLADVTRDLHTADFLTAVFSGNINPIWLPLLTFIMAALFSFSTGSSWGTMAIMYPLILPTTWVLCKESGMTPGETMHIFYNVTAVVLGGSVLGDHCSPIADTTVLSSLATGCNHIDHVSTQLPYALTVGTVALLVGGVIFVLGLPWYVDYLIGLLLLVILVRVIGKPSPQTYLDNGEVKAMAEE